MSDIDNLKDILFAANELYTNTRIQVIAISLKTKAAIYSKEDLCDLGFLSRELVSKLEEIRKDIGAMKILIDKVMCIKSMQITIMDPTKDDTIHGALSSGKPYYKKSVTLPKKDSAEFFEMLEYFGVTEKGIQLGVAKISWKQICNHVTELAELGKPIPKFLPTIHDDYTVIHRRKN